MAGEKLSLAELKNKAISFDRAEIRDVHVVKGEDDYLCKRVMGVWNIDKNMLACLGPKNYSVIQHRHATESIVEALTSLNIKAEASIKTSTHGIYVDFDFPDTFVELKEVGEKFITGIRVMSDYSQIAGLQISPRLVRLACSNGMVVSELVKSQRIRYTEQLHITVEGIIDKVIKDLISSDEKLANMVSICMKDSVEWAAAKLLAKALFTRKKHVKEILTRVKPSDDGRVNRWIFYNAITEYLSTTGSRLKPQLEMWMQNKAQKVFATPFGELTEELIKVEDKKR